MFEALEYTVYVRDKYFPVLRTLREAIDYSQVHVNVQKRAIRFRENVDNTCFTFIHYRHMVIVINGFIVHYC